MKVHRAESSVYFVMLSNMQDSHTMYWWFLHVKNKFIILYLVHAINIKGSVNRKRPPLCKIPLITLDILYLV